LAAEAVDSPQPIWTVERRSLGWCGLFQAMASPCEVHVSGVGRGKAEGLVALVSDEAGRIEQKYSRYLEGNIVHRINTANGQAVEVDEETGRLLDYAATLYELSEGRFDITSGVLRRAWTFDGGEAIPRPERIEAVRANVGWDKVEWRNPVLRMPAGMEIDFGGIGKEYAVDRAAALAGAETNACMINFGGDLVALGPPGGKARHGEGWSVGLENLQGGASGRRISLTKGALATSGDTRRYLIRDGRRYGHILDARTGWPVADAPHTVTVLASTCTQAGMLATFAMLMGADAEQFLDDQQAEYWCLR
jgi:thiamine biosynthesis lipoprotein